MSGGPNVERAQAILQELADCGVRDICLCAGARNAPFVAALEQLQGLRALSFFEERAAAFFALGRARRDSRPVAVVVTSGTAAAELLPAVIEAFYSGVPLVLITADRPRRLRGTGAPQTINQVDLFRNFVEAERDVDIHEPLHLEAWSGGGSLHLNICFDEPLIVGPIKPWTVEVASTPRAVKHETYGASASDAAINFAKALAEARTPLAIVSGLDFEGERAGAKAILLALGAPIYAEAASGLREDPELAPLLLKSGDRILEWALKQKKFDCVLRLGSVPTVRLWRDLEEMKDAIPTISVSRLRFAGLSRAKHWQADISTFAQHAAPRIQQRAASQEVMSRDAEFASRLQGALDNYPHSEPALIRSLSHSMSAQASLYVGNSLPIREWDLAAERTRPRWTRASRGANGIDGQISTYLGAAGAGEEAWCLVGDLTALYDLAAPWAIQHCAAASVNIAVVNNGGGRIFSRVLARSSGVSLFENRHDLDFEHFAKAWRLTYVGWTGEDTLPPPAGSRLIEIKPDESETTAFWNHHDQMWGEV